MVGRLLYDEPLLRPSKRKAILPVEYPEIWSRYKKAQGSYWPAEDINFKNDLAHWEALDEGTREVLKAILAFFSMADAIVNANLAHSFMEIIEILEVKFFYQAQLFVEGIHNETYSKMIQNLIRDEAEQERLRNSFETMPAVAAMYEWSMRWIHQTADDELSNPILKYYEEEGASDEVLEDLSFIWSFAKRLVAFACVEGIMFSGAFAIIYWIKERGILPGLTFSNELISRDEGMHYDFACLLYSMVKHRPPDDQIRQIVLEATTLSKDLILGCMGGRLAYGMNPKDMCTYIEFVGDKALRDLGQVPEFGAANPFPFMDKTAFNGITNFFEKDVAEYAKTGNDDVELDLADDNY